MYITTSVLSVAALIVNALATGPLFNHDPSCDYPGGDPIATIDAGVVIGTTTSLPSATATVNKFLGVPFAKSPPTRFSPPESPGMFGQPISAKEWRPACIQQFLYPRSAYEFTRAVFNQPTPEESEDCL